MGYPAFGYRQIPLAERVQLVEDIWDSIAQEANARPDALPLSDAQRTELARRIADADAHPGEGISWEQVRRDELRHHSRSSWWELAKDYFKRVGSAVFTSASVTRL